MIIYTPAFIDGKRDVLAFETQDARLIKTLGYGESVIYRGMIFSATDFFTEKEAAFYDWNKEYTKTIPYRIKADDPAIKWQNITIIGS